MGRIGFGAAMLVVLVCIRAAAHRPEHRPAPRAEEAHQQRRREQQEDDVENGRVVPLDALRGDLGRPLRTEKVRPRPASRRPAAHSIWKIGLTAVYPPRLSGRRRKVPSEPMLMSMAGWPSMDPARPLSAWARAAWMSRLRTKSRNATA